MDEAGREFVSLPMPRREEIDGGVLWRAPAKLNLTLAVLGRRPDGYHELDSIVVRISQYDELRVRPRRDGEIRLECTGADCGPIDRNLVFRAADALRRRCGVSAGATLELVKRIRPGSGLGGGSSDAAAALVALAELWGVEPRPGDLEELAAGLGSDVPLFLRPPTVRMRGRGEVLEPADVQPFWALVHTPPVSCSTAAVYARHDRSEATGPASQAPRPGPAEFAGSVDSWAGRLFNDLLPAAEEVAPELKERRRLLADALARPVHLTGSGSALFAIAATREESEAGWHRLPAEFRPQTRVVTMNPW